MEEFLSRVQEWFEVVVYTASLSLYADPLLDQMDPEGWVSYRLFREHCTPCGNALVKDLSLLGRDLKDVIIVDNSPASYALQPENAIPIVTWIDDMTDDRLAQLLPLLELFTQTHDVRPYIRQLFASEIVDYAEAAEYLRTELVQHPSITPRLPAVNSWVKAEPKQDPAPRQLTIRMSQQKAMVALKALDGVKVGPLTPQATSKGYQIIN